MDDIIGAVIEIVGTVIEDIFDNIKNPQKRKWALTAFYSVIALAVAGFMLWLTVSTADAFYPIGTIILGTITGALSVIFAFFIVRGHRRSWRRESKRKR